jgi:hypothetical protein
MPAKQVYFTNALHTLNETGIRWMTLQWPEPAQVTLHHLDQRLHLGSLQFLHKDLPLSEKRQSQTNNVNGLIWENFLDGHFISGNPDRPCQCRKAR